MTNLCPLCRKPLPSALTGIGSDRQIVECSCGAVGLVPTMAAAQPHSADVRAAVAEANALVDGAWSLPGGDVTMRGPSATIIVRAGGGAYRFDSGAFQHAPVNADGTIDEDAWYEVDPNAETEPEAAEARRVLRAAHEPSDAEVDEGVVCEALSATSSSKLLDALECAERLVRLLTIANDGSHPIVSHSLVPLIGNALTLRRSIETLRDAILGE